MSRTIAQIRRAFGQLAFNISDLEDHIDLEDVDRHVEALEILVEQAQEDKDEAEDKDSDEEDSSDDE